VTAGNDVRGVKVFTSDACEVLRLSLAQIMYRNMLLNFVI